ncbi:iron-containing alcohol dehydrogenase [Streptomyces azureus]|uniref:Alcohol dehydrogenase n=1 Tax=Streptomyces azureus TaxID=146537 RepID=A0A0K8PP90_STRAJ|nr:iron-containing alcohol dehydrogenase [Streptomyces azureus]GAP49687.1 alcohol dehydrogenase [Streptomyces azureus]
MTTVVPLAVRAEPATAFQPARWSRPTELLIGQGAAREAVRQARSDGTTVLVTDTSLPEGLVDRLVGPAGKRLRRLGLHPGSITLASSGEIADSLGDVRHVVAIGGGSVLDAAAVARAILSRPELSTLIRRPTMPGLILCPPGRRPVPRFTAVPTTVGTAAEVSSLATVLACDRRKLVTGDALTPGTAALDPAATAGLPRRLLLEGVLEAMMRLLNICALPPVGQCPGASDAELLTLLAQLGRSGAEAANARYDVPAPLRIDIALLSARTVLGWTALGRDPFGGKIWYLSNELSTLAGVRKMTATVSVAPVVWSRLLAGDTRFGDPARLHTAWQALWRALGPMRLPTDPVAGFRALVAAWDVPALRKTEAPPPQELAWRTAQAWGGSQPMLGAFSAAELTALYREIIDQPRPRRSQL